MLQASLESQARFVRPLQIDWALAEDPVMIEKPIIMAKAIITPRNIASILDMKCPLCRLILVLFNTGGCKYK